MAIINLMSGATTAGSTTTTQITGNTFVGRTYQATVQGMGAVAANVSVMVSNDNVVFVPFLIFDLSGTGVAADGQSTYAPWNYLKVVVNSISGTSAMVSVNMGL